MTLDLISDMLTRLRNATIINKKLISLPFNKNNYIIIKILEQEGYIFCSTFINNKDKLFLKLLELIFIKKNFSYHDNRVKNLLFFIRTMVKTHFNPDDIRKYFGDEKKKSRIPILLRIMDNPRINRNKNQKETLSHIDDPMFSLISKFKTSYTKSKKIKLKSNRLKQKVLIKKKSSLTDPKIDNISSLIEKKNDGKFKLRKLKKKKKKLNAVKSDANELTKNAESEKSESSELKKNDENVISNPSELNENEKAIKSNANELTKNLEDEKSNRTELNKNLKDKKSSLKKLKKKKKKNLDIIKSNPSELKKKNLDTTESNPRKKKKKKLKAIKSDANELNKNLEAEKSKPKKLKKNLDEKSNPKKLKKKKKKLKLIKSDANKLTKNAEPEKSESNELKKNDENVISNPSELNKNEKTIKSDTNELTKNAENEKSDSSKLKNIEEKANETDSNAIPKPTLKKSALKRRIKPEEKANFVPYYFDPKLGKIVTRKFDKNAIESGNFSTTVSPSPPIAEKKKEIKRPPHLGKYLRKKNNKIFQTLFNPDFSKMILLALNFDAKEKSSIHGIRRISKPSLRCYSGNPIPRSFGGLGVFIVSTNCGIMTDKKAREKKLGGEIMLEIW